MSSFRHDLRESLPGQQSHGEELANAVSHGLGALVGLVGLVWMVVQASIGGDPWRIVAVSLYGTTLVLLFGASALYHGARDPHVKHVGWLLDHGAIYLLIAGSYTPFCLVTLRGAWGWSLFGVIWALALIGVVYQLLWIGRYPWISLGLYVGMGWLAIVAAWPIANALPAGGLALLVAGGLFYTVGVLFYRWHSVRYTHFVWHLFVLAGAGSHLAAVSGYVLPVAG